MQGLVRLREAVEGLRAVDLADVSGDDLIAAMPELHELDSMLVAHQARLVAEIDARRLWRRDGSRALWAWLARTTGAAAGAAKALAGLGRRLRLAPPAPSTATTPAPNTSPAPPHNAAPTPWPSWPGAPWPHPPTANHPGRWSPSTSAPAPSSGCASSPRAP
ncbi:MAG: hypothetical protein ACRD2C_10260 [Acidimicrobiales bacterium]